MLLDCDFERHGFALRSTEGDIKKYIPAHQLRNLKPATHIISVWRLKKGVQKVHLWVGEDLGFEIMWSPEQLRVFLIFHRVIEHNLKLLLLLVIPKAVKS